MNGLGFLIWRLDEIAKYLTPLQLVELCEDVGVKWLSVKIADGEIPVNKNAIGNDSLLLSYGQEVQAAGIEWGGWPYCYPYPPSRATVEAKLYDERVNTLGLEHLLYDAETEWKKPGLEQQINQICDIQSGPAGLCSYRFPDLHRELNWKVWLSQSKMSFVAPQVYWEQMHNPGDQLRRSYAQYRKLTNKPYIPIGSSYGRGTWEPTAADLEEFIITAKELNCPAYGFYSLDWILKHGKYDWLSAIAKQTVEPPKPPEPPPPEVLPMQVRTKTVVNVRNAPTLVNSDVGNFDPDKVMNVIAKVGEFFKVEIYVHESVVEPVVIPPPPTTPEYYVAHDSEKGVIRSAAPNPEVFWLSDKMVKLTAAWQQLIYDMNQPFMTTKAFRQNLAYNVAWANDTGFNEVGDPRRDYINKLNLEAKYPFLDKCRICGGATIRGTESNGILTVEVLDGSKPPPSWEWLKVRPWLYFRAWIVNVDGSVFDFPYCGGQPLYMPLVGIPSVVVQLNLNVPDKPIPYIVRK